MEDIDYSLESEDEFFEDFGDNSLSDEKLEEVLIKARKNSDAELRKIVKELQYTRFLLKNLIDSNEDNGLLTIQKLAKMYVEANEEANKKLNF